MDHHESNKEKYNKSSNGQDHSRRSEKFQRVYFTTRMGVYWRGVWKRGMPARWREPLAANGMLQSVVGCARTELDVQVQAFP